MLDQLIDEAIRHERNFIRPLRLGGPISLISRVKRLYLKEYLEGEELLWGKNYAEKVAQETCAKIENALETRPKSVQEARIKRRPRRT